MCESIAFVLTLLHIGPTTIGVHYVENVGTAFPPSSCLLSHDSKARATEEMCSCFLTALRYSRFKLGRINYEGVSNPSYNQHILRCSQYTGLQLCRTVGHIVKLSCRAELFDYI